MKFFSSSLSLSSGWLLPLFYVGLIFTPAPVQAQEEMTPQDRQIPPLLLPWTDWATWDVRRCPTTYQDGDKLLCLWPSALSLTAGPKGADFSVSVECYAPTWMRLPGSRDLWPSGVLANGRSIPVLERNQHPAIRLEPGTYRITGRMDWKEMPQRIALPRDIGILNLTLSDQSVRVPVWDAEGFVWLRRDRVTDAGEKDFLELKVYRLLEDGIPMWLRTEVELTVAGKSREEELGNILPEGWQLAAIESPVPVTVDEDGMIKAQVRTGRWKIQLSAFRLESPEEFQYPEGAKPAVSEELLAFQARPDLRLVELLGLPSIDVSQTTFPAPWRQFPVYLWSTDQPFQIEERIRGMGEEQPQGLTVQRRLWLDESGKSLTFQDRITGVRQQIWRLDTAPGQELGSVQSNGEGQLITLNPIDGAPGVEIRSRDLNLLATGKMENESRLSATGWQTDADNLQVTLNLPPGWRLFALFGADRVEGDWLTSWTLLDLFLLLVFSLAVFRLWGFFPGLIAFLGFALSYHEPGAPRYLWLALLVPLALLRVVHIGWGKKLVLIWKYATLAILLLVLIPFVASQVQQAIYPQLEELESTPFGRVEYVAVPEPADFEMTSNAMVAAPVEKDSYQRRLWSTTSAPSQLEKGNLLYEAGARIQTGPGIPDWTWRTVQFLWNGPVPIGQEVRPIFISATMERFLTVVRIALLLVLAALLLGWSRSKLQVPTGASVLALVGAFCFFPATVQAQFPNEEMLETLRSRLIEPSDAYPHAAEIPFARLTLQAHRFVLEAEIHTATLTAVPIPGRLPAWSPVNVTVDGATGAALRRSDDFLWVALPAGVHQVRVEGVLPEVTEWEWAFHLAPRRVAVDAPGWQVSGVREDGVPEQQVFFVLQQRGAAVGSTYERQDFQAVVAVERHLELGLVWQVRTTVTRLSPEGKALSLRIPLLPGERVLTADALVEGDSMDVRLGARETSTSWQSELSPIHELSLRSRETDSWVERWFLVASPVWNVTYEGLAPIFLPADPELIPVWYPWPGEGVDLTISRPEALLGATVTVDSIRLSTALGQRQRTATLDLALRSSLGEEFAIELPETAEVTSLSMGDQSIPVRRDGNRLLLSLQPGEQKISTTWRSNEPLDFVARGPAVSLPVESANINLQITTPEDRWILWADGPLRGPAVRFWTVLVCSFLAAWILGSLRLTPLRTWQWMLLALGLTQVDLFSALLVVGWLFALAWRGGEKYPQLSEPVKGLVQIGLALLTAVTLLIFFRVVAEGLLGRPEMFIQGNNSHGQYLNWYQAQSGLELPRPGVTSVSIWWYRFFMLAWALWLASSLIRWLWWGWSQFSKGGCFPPMKRTKPDGPPPLP